MLESFMHDMCTQVIFSFLCMFWFDVLCKIFSTYWVLFVMQMSITPYVGIADGASCSTKNLSSAAWVIYNPAGELNNL